MELRHLRYLVAVANEGSFVAAAARLRVAQPALSRQVRDLEEELGVELLAREAGGSRLTVAGEAVVAIGRNIILSVNSAIARARLAEHGLVGRCTIGVGRYPLAWQLIKRLIELVRTEYPGIEIVIDQASHGGLWDRIASAEIDIGLGTAPKGQQMHLSAEAFARDVFDMVAISASHPLAKRKSLRLEELRGETFVSLDPEVGSEPYLLVEREFAARGFAPANVRYTSNRDSLGILVRAGAGWTALPRSMRESTQSDTVAIPLEDLAVPFRYVQVHRRAEDRPVVLSILGVLRRLARAEASAVGAVAPADEDAPAQGSPPEQAERGTRVELRHLRYFVAALEHESIGRAAEALGLTQPALSRQIRDLEADVGATLVTRAARGIAPTAAGESLRNDVVRILSIADRIGSEAQRVVRGSAGRVVVGVAASALTWEVVTRVVSSMTRTHPRTDVLVEDLPTPFQAAALREARLDIAMGHRLPGNSDGDTTLIREPLLLDSLEVALLPENDPLASRESIAAAELGDRPFIFVRRDFSPALYDQVLNGLARANYVPRLAGTADAKPAIWALVAQGLGWGIGSTILLTNPPTGVKAVRLRDFRIPWGTEIAYRRGESRPAVLAVLQAARDAAHTLGGAGMASQEMKYWPEVGRAG
jgi:DNA-binding transcriptional LysR family regulator